MRRLSLFIVFLATLAGAQTGDRVRPALERTDEVIKAIKPLIERSGIEKAAQFLAVAEQIEDQAWIAFNDNQFKLALGLTMKARDRAKQAALLVLDPDRISGEIKKIAEKMKEIEPIIHASNDPKATELWNLADGELATASEMFDKKRYGMAIRFARAAEGHARDAWEIVRGSIDPAKVQTELDRTDALIERAQEILKTLHNERANQLLDKARDWENQAQTAYESRHFGQAIKFTLAARDLILRAWEAAQRTPGPALVERALAETDQLLTNWTETIRSKGPDEAKGLLDQAIQHQAQARQYLDARNLKSAFQETSTARRLLNRAIELTQPEEPSPEQN